jgi:hypothetical protein
MQGLDLFELSALLLISSAQPQLIKAESADYCLVPPRPKVEVTVSEKPVEFNLDKSKKELSELKIDTKSPYPAHYHTEVGGVMNGEFIVDHKVSFKKQIDDKTGKGCLWLEKVNVNIHLEPTIYIANEYENDGCWFKEVFIHESKHVEVDRQILNHYQDVFIDGLHLVLLDDKYLSSGYIEEEKLPDEKNNMHEGVTVTLNALFHEMMYERQNSQQSIDSLEEYTRISKAC